MGRNYEFPPIGEVEIAYSAAQSINRQVQSPQGAIDLVHRELGALPGMNHAQIAEALAEECREDIVDRHSDIFEAIGIELVAGSKPLMLGQRAVGMAGIRPIVPELSEPERYASFVDTLGSNIPRNSVHYALAKEVLDNLESRIDQLKVQWSMFESFEWADDETLDEIHAHSEETMDLFRLLLPVYFKAGLTDFKSFSRLEDRLRKDFLMSPKPPELQ